MRSAVQWANYRNHHRIGNKEYSNLFSLIFTWLRTSTDFQRLRCFAFATTMSTDTKWKSWFQFALPLQRATVHYVVESRDRCHGRPLGHIVKNSFADVDGWMNWMEVAVTHFTTALEGVMLILLGRLLCDILQLDFATAQHMRNHQRNNQCCNHTNHKSSSCSRKSDRSRGSRDCEVIDYGQSSLHIQHNRHGRQNMCRCCCLH